MAIEGEVRYDQTSGKRQKYVNGAYVDVPDYVPGASGATFKTPQFTQTTPEYKRTSSPYSLNYLDQLKQRIYGSAQSSLTGPAAQAQARTSRAQLAGKGTLSGTAFDRLQEQRASNVMSQADVAANEAVSSASLRGMEFESEQDRLANARAEDISRERSMWEKSGRTEAIRQQLSALEPIIRSGNATDEQRDQYDFLYEEMMGDGASTQDYSAGLAQEGEDAQIERMRILKGIADEPKTERFATAANLETTMDKKLDPATYTKSQLVSWAQPAIDAGLLTNEQINDVVNSYDFDTWQQKDNIRNALLSVIRTGQLPEITPQPEKSAGERKLEEDRKRRESRGGYV